MSQREKAPFTPHLRWEWRLSSCSGVRLNAELTQIIAESLRVCVGVWGPGKKDKPPSSLGENQQMRTGGAARSRSRHAQVLFVQRHEGKHQGRQLEEENVAASRQEKSGLLPSHEELLASLNQEHGQF